METLCTAQEIAAHNAYLTRFHKHRLRLGASREALDERACFTQSYSTDIVRCRTCGLVLRDPRPDNRAIAEMYAKDSYGSERLENIFAAQCALYRPKARRLAKWLKPGANVIEVGSFVGGFLVAGRELGWNMRGVDPGEEVAEFCREKGLAVLQGTLDQADQPEASVDCIAIWNTFDQLPDPSPALCAANRLLKSAGILALRVPNGEFFAAASRALRRLRHGTLAPGANVLLTAMVWNNMLAFPYLYGYSASSLDRLLAPYGLTRLQVDPDTLVALADRDTKAWAAWEERAVKAGLRTFARAQACLPGDRYSLSPWLDLFYVKDRLATLDNSGDPPDNQRCE